MNSCTVARFKLPSYNSMLVACTHAAPQHNLEEVEEIENGEEFSPNDDGYSTYAVPDPEVVKMKAARREMEEQEALKTSANQKLLKDALQDLSGDESPPEVPKQNFAGEEEQVVQSGSRVSVGSSKGSRVSACGVQ